MLSSTASTSPKSANGNGPIDWRALNPGRARDLASRRAGAYAEKKDMEIRHHLFDRISMDPDKCFGKPCIRGLRMPVASVLAYLSGGMSIDAMLSEWPELEREDIYQALGFAATLMEEKVVPLEHR
jgi:uncharacterized protein (DUF433 family)